MTMVQKLETDPEKLREWQVGILIEITRRVLDEDEDNRAMNLADDACKTVFAERGMTF